MKRPTPFDVAIAGFDKAMRVAEKHRHELKSRFGFTDAMIGHAVLARRAKDRGGPMKGLAKATLAAKERMKS
jgi:hypothetical protein